MKESWEMSRELLTFFASLFGIKISRMLKIETMSVMLEDDDDDVTHGDDVDVTHDDDVGPEESTTDIGWTVINPQTLLSCLHEILTYEILKGVKRRLSTSDNLRTTFISLDFAHFLGTLTR